MGLHWEKNITKLEYLPSKLTSAPQRRRILAAYPSPRSATLKSEQLMPSTNTSELDSCSRSSTKELHLLGSSSVLLTRQIRKKVSQTNKPSGSCIIPTNHRLNIGQAELPVLCMAAVVFLQTNNTHDSIYQWLIFIDDSPKSMEKRHGSSV